MLKPAATYDDLLARFRWVIPERYNIATTCCDNWAMAAPDRPAVIDVSPCGAVDVLTYGVLQEQANRLANALQDRGILAGDRVAIMLPQGRHVPITHMAVYKLGAIAVPLANLFGVDAIGYRLKDSGAAALVTNATGLSKVRKARLSSPLVGEGITCSSSPLMARTAMHWASTPSSNLPALNSPPQTHWPMIRP